MQTMQTTLKHKCHAASLADAERSLHVYITQVFTR